MQEKIVFFFKNKHFASGLFCILKTIIQSIQRYFWSAYIGLGLLCNDEVADLHDFCVKKTNFVPCIRGVVTCNFDLVNSEKTVIFLPVYLKNDTNILN